MFALCYAGIAASIAAFREMNFVGTCQKVLSLVPQNHSF